jgi:hypothetical protein
MGILEEVEGWLVYLRKRKLFGSVGGRSAVATPPRLVRLRCLFRQSTDHENHEGAARAIHETINTMRECIDHKSLRLMQ